jgi:hypothetical protein
MSISKSLVAVAMLLALPVTAAFPQEPPATTGPFKSVHLVKLTDAQVVRLQAALADLNAATAKAGYPETQYRLYKVTGKQSGNFNYLWESSWAIAARCIRRSTPTRNGSRFTTVCQVPHAEEPEFCRRNAFQNNRNVGPSSRLKRLGETDLVGFGAFVLRHPLSSTRPHSSFAFAPVIVALSGFPNRSVTRG